VTHFETLFQIPGTQFYSLHVESRADKASPIFAQYGVRNCGPEINDFSDTAALIQNLDLIISVDTAVAHLAGAMGKPTWVLLPYIPDWRWLMGRQDSPWYTSVRLFRQRKPGDWKHVFDKVAFHIEKRDSLPKPLANGQFKPMN
jgi:hypothetical protein